MDVVEQISTVRQAWVRAVAAQEAVAYAQQVQEAAGIGTELARRMQSVGNISKLQGARQQLWYAQATAQLAQARDEAQAGREALVRALGLDSLQAQALRLPARLPDLVALIRPGAEITTGTSASELLMRLHREFLSTRPALVAAMVGARERRDWAELARRAHHLKSSADLLQLPDLSAACAALYAVAETDEDSAEPAADHALHKLLTALDEVPPEYGNPTASTGARFPV
jgi:HPt (histidine-containing phosphotransfer) domain-containing protein